MGEEKFFKFLLIYIGGVLILFSSIGLISNANMSNDFESIVFSTTFLVVGICFVLYGIYNILSSKK